ncbi:MAG TPA: hypothetical protein VFI11_08165 [Anaerolineales bacterium]|nr:hypothetical protein [Anaerolineales bacterium]
MPAFRIRPRTTWRWLALGVTAALLVAPLATVAAPRFATLSLSPSSGPAGSSVNVSGSGWTPSPNNPPYALFWDVKGGPSLGSFSPSASGTWSTNITVPGGASPGAHNVVACEGYGIEFEACSTAVFTVVAPSHTPVPKPSSTWTPPGPPTRTPTVTSTATATRPPTACGDLGLGPEAEVMTFDAPFEGSSSVGFEFSASVEPPTAVRPHSGTLAARSLVAMEFGSALMPITMLFFPIGATAVGMFVGLDTAVYVDSDVTATLTAFGYRPGSTALELLGTGSVTFPPLPTDLQHCLVFRAGEGETIARIEIEYTDAAGISLADPRWIDDVTFVWADEPLPVDELPPLVEITQPEARTVLVGGSVDVRAAITEDRNLDRVAYRINGGPEQAIGYSRIAGDPTRYLTGFGVSPLSLVPYSDNEIEVVARDAAGLEGRDQIVVYYNPPTPTPSLDIDLYKIEITQAIQCLDNPRCADNAVSLYEGKPTLVRAYLRTLNGAAVPAVSGELCYTPAGAGGGCTRILSLGPAPSGTDENPVPSSRPTLASTLNFLLPPDAVANEGSLRFSIDVNPEQEPAECCYLNNHGDYTFSIRRSKRLDVVFVPIQVRGTRGALGEMWPVLDWLLRVYPTSDIRPWTIGEGRGLNPEADDTLFTGFGCGSFWNDILDEMWWYGFWTDDPVDWMRYYGLVDLGAARTGDPGGCGKTPGYESAGFVETGDRRGPEIAAQEIGHNHDRTHAPGCGAGDPDGGYPMPSGFIDEWGLDIGRMQPYDPALTYDFMGYCGGESNTWVSIYTYTALARGLRRIAAAPGAPGLLASPRQPQAEADHLVASGEVLPDSVHLTRGFYRVPLPAGTVDDLPEGPYAVELVDAAGAVLSQRSFGPAPMSNAPPGDGGPIQLILPWIEGTSRVVFRYQGAEIADYPASAQPPAVRLLAPNGGETWPAEGSQTIRWEASDPDSPALTYSLQVSPDNGQTWRALVNFTPENQATIDTAMIPGSENARVRVVASDGFHTAVDTSDASFIVEGKGPFLSILSPEDGANFADGRSAVLRGAATDLEDGPIDPSSLLWSSSLDGDLGTGSSLWALELSTGRHEITLTATDVDGEIARERVTIFIGEEAPTRPTSLAMTFTLAGLLLVAVAGVGLVVYALRRRGPGQ